MLKSVVIVGGGTKYVADQAEDLVGRLPGQFGYLAHQLYDQQARHRVPEPQA